MIKYSKSTGGFYDTRIHDQIPEDAIDVDGAQHAALMQGQANGQVIIAGAAGAPELADVVLTTEQLAANARARRDMLLVDADRAINKLEDSGQGTTAWRKHRQDLRDVPALPGFPTSFTWPATPA